jgi:hypothetical protein
MAILSIVLRKVVIFGQHIESNKYYITYRAI